MAVKKKFEKPQMETIKLDTNVVILAGSCIVVGCGSVEICSDDWICATVS